MYDINTRQTLADNLKICTKGFDDLEVVRDRLAKCNEQQDRIWNGLNHQVHGKTFNHLLVHTRRLYFAD